MKVLFVCRGNVGRSQMAEALFIQLSKDKHAAESAGTKVVSKTGEDRGGQILKDLPAAEFVIESLRELGIDVSEKVRDWVTPEMVQEADKIIVMAESETIPDYLRESSKTIYWEVKDPKGESFEVHKEIRDHIKELVTGLIKEIERDINPEPLRELKKMF